MFNKAPESKRDVRAAFAWESNVSCPQPQSVKKSLLRDKWLDRWT